jgi:signal transduction histidine kinase/FixJ family two-component response regulator
MKRFMESVKIKVSLGYFMLVILASLMIWVTYSEILQYSGEKVDFNPANNKFIYINNILTNLYQAEGLERSYVQTQQKIHYHDYLKIMDTISLQIDTLALMVNTPIQQMHTDSIKKLLKVKQQNLKELSAIKKKSSSSASYQRALKKLNLGKDSVNQYMKVSRNVTTNLDSIYIKQKKKNFFERVANVFTKQKSADSTLHVLTTRSVQTDSLANTGNPADTIAGLITAVITQIKEDSIAMESRVKQKEQEVLANDRTITLQLRQMLSSIENEELINSFNKVKAQQSRIEKKTGLIILVGSFALVTILFFLVNILKDITRSQHYRQSLEEAKAYSESLLKSKEQFMLSLTHDLKSPLSSIIGFTGFMQGDANVSPQHKNYLQNISKASNHILKLVNDLLDLARLETGKLTIDQIPFNLKPLIDDIVEGFRPQARAKNIEMQLQYNISPSAIYISDPMRITQILSNLISNAIKFSEEGKVSIAISGIGSTEKSDRVQMDVVDTGIGISAENAQLIFEEFTRITTTTKQYEGTGLGLTITQKLVHLLHGTINLESKPGEGSRFSIILPLEKGNQLTADSPKIIKKVSRGAKPEIAGNKVWLIDDDQTLLEMTTAILNSAGMEVHPFSDPGKAINLFTKGCANVLITDIQMPGMNGVEVLKHISEKNGGLIKSIAISGSSNGRIEFAGFSAFIQKPFNPQTLIDVISGQLEETAVSINYVVKENSGKTGYNLKQLDAFAEGDPEVLRQILESFISTGKQNAVLFRQYIFEENYNGLSELSHKMLPLFRQLEAYDIAELLSQLEQKDFARLYSIKYFSQGKSVLERIDRLLDTIQNEENIVL